MPWPATAAPYAAALPLPVAARTVHVLHPSGDAARLEALILPASATALSARRRCGRPVASWRAWLRYAERRAG